MHCDNDLINVMSSLSHYGGFIKEKWMKYYTRFY